MERKNKDNDRRITIRFNPVEVAELELLKKSWGVTNDSEAAKMAVRWVNSYIKNVTQCFFPPNYDVVLMKKLKTQRTDRKVYD